MELKEYDVALASFEEALRIRHVAYGRERPHHPLIVRLLNNIGCALFEMDQLEESRLTFENALQMQRRLMKAKREFVLSGGGGEDGNDVNPKDAYQMPLSIALTLTNLGSIHLRLSELDKSLVCFEEAVLIQESVLGENHKIVANTKESIEFVIKSQEEEGKKKAGESIKIERITDMFSCVGYNEGKRICTKMQEFTCDPGDYNCDQPLCADANLGSQLVHDSC